MKVAEGEAAGEGEVKKKTTGKSGLKEGQVLGLGSFTWKYEGKGFKQEVYNKTTEGWLLIRTVFHQWLHHSAEERKLVT